ncbi:MAG: HupE/UreJ family protein [Gallionella sp.]|nr:HupE/UreJ family protein [Gallionella sp.]
MSQSALMRFLLTVMAGVLLPSSVYAHVGVGEASGFLHGLTHPTSGLDHVCAMLAVGLWAAQMGGRSVWAVPLTFVSVMALGGALPMLDISLPFVEQGIVLSVLLLGVLIAASARLPLWLSGSIVGLFALWHGHAHGAEMPALASGIEYALGFMLATAFLHIIGIVFGLGMQRLPALMKLLAIRLGYQEAIAKSLVMSLAEGASERVIRAAGASIVLCGIYLSAV